MRSQRIHRGRRSRYARTAIIALSAAGLLAAAAAFGIGSIPTLPGMTQKAVISSASAAPSIARDGIDAPSWPVAAGLTAAASQDIIKRIGAMSADEKVGQLVIAGLEGIKPGQDAETLINKYRVGGFILFRDNMTTLQGTVDLLNGLKALNRTAGNAPLFFGVDEEGGRISRMPSSIEKVPSNAVIGKTGNSDYAREVAQLLARRVKSLGFSIDFAPVLDVNSNKDNPVIGDRSYGSSSPLVAKLGTAAMLGFKKEGVLGVVKHFPGHGDTSVDSHKQLPISANGLSRLTDVELRPFQSAIDQGADAVMVAHILLPKLDSDNPASMSKNIITGLLRDKMKFNGLVMTDDLTMGAILENYDVGDAAVRSIQAGGDMVIISHGSESILKALKKLRLAVADGTISSSRLNESVYRILARKSLYNLKDDPVKNFNASSLNKDALKTLEPYRK